MTRALAMLLWSVGALVHPVAAQDRPAGDEVDQFQHGRHAGLFPLCTGCHESAATERAPRGLYPQTEQCGSCHDGVDVDSVTWSGPTPSATHLDFDHAVHARAVIADGQERTPCEGCHQAPAGDRWDVVRASEAGCATCHTRSDHLEQTPCRTCHVAVAASAVPADRVAEWSPPASHSRPTYLADHGTALTDGAVGDQCATCHTRDQCLDCHVSGLGAGEESFPATLPSLLALSLDPRYPTPPDHAAPDWLAAHGRELDAADCVTCHTRDDCASCHPAPLPAAAASLTPRRPAAAPGVAVSRRLPLNHQIPGFDQRHGDLSAAAPSCGGCHAEVTCVRCHGGDPTPAAGASTRVRASIVAGAIHQPPTRVRPSSRATAAAPMTSAVPTAGFHPPAYELQHAPDAWNGLLECANCHETQTFCRACHQDAGVSASGRLGAGYHDAQPFWLLRHAQPARQALESCAGCHTQRECLQCHSSTGAFRISPHGSDFDADGMRERAGRMCFACHLGGPP